MFLSRKTHDVGPVNRDWIAPIFRVASILVVALIIVLSVTGYYSVRTSSITNARVMHTFASYDTYIMLEGALDRENAQLNKNLMDPSSAAPSEITLMRNNEFNATLASAQMNHIAPGELPLLRRVSIDHQAYIAASAKVLEAAHLKSRVDNVEVNKLHGALDSMLELTAADRLRTAESQYRGAEQTATVLLRTFVTTALATIAIVVALLYAVNVYRRRYAALVSDEMNTLRDAAMMDGLTQLGNHRAFYDDFERELARSRRHERPLTLVVLDIDNFKSLNDAKGHTYGDEILAQLAHLLKHLRRGDTGYRIGGDEFALLLVESDAEQSAKVLERLFKLVSQTFSGVMISAGFAQVDGDISAQDLREQADTALYEAKRRGRNTFVDFQSIQGTASVISSVKKNALTRLLTEPDALDIAFQPIWDIGVTRIIGFEALARPNPSLGLEGPQDAFDVAERLHKAFDLDQVCAKRTISLAQTLPKDAVLFLNVLPETLVHPRFRPEDFLAHIKSASIDQRRIVIEVTERQITSPAKLAECAAKLQSLGMRIALDDTGSGSAGLEVLSSLHLDYVKIDRGLIVKAQTDRRARGVLAGIIAIAQETGSFLIAEGIENVEQLEFVRHVHERPDHDLAAVNGVQGYLLGRPQCGAVDTASLSDVSNHLNLRGKVAS